VGWIQFQIHTQIQVVGGAPGLRFEFGFGPWSTPTPRLEPQTSFQLVFTGTGRFASEAGATAGEPFQSQTQTQVDESGVTGEDDGSPRFSGTCRFVAPNWFERAEAAASWLAETACAADCA
jgi:hypothetical protein